MNSNYNFLNTVHLKCRELVQRLERVHASGQTESNTGNKYLSLCHWDVKEIVLLAKWMLLSL